MQLFLFNDSMDKSLNNRIDCFFNGEELRIFFGGGLVERYTDAKIGDVYNIEPHGNNRPTVTKAALPLGRGNKLMWALALVEPEKRAAGFDQFYNFLEFKASQYGSKEYKVIMKNDIYGILLVKKHNKPGSGKKKKDGDYSWKPLWGWISDDISEANLDILIAQYSEIRKIYVPKEYLYCL